MPKALGALLLFVVALLIAGCGDDEDGGEGGEAGALREATLMLPVPESITVIGLVVADELGYFADEGLELEIVVAEEGSGQVNQLLIAGQQQFGYSTPGLTMIANGEGNDLRMIATLARDNFTIEVPADSEIQSVEDLEGEALGVTDLAGGEISLVQQALANAGLEPNEDVELVVVGPGGPAAFRAVDTGEVAAYAAAPNDLAGMQALGFESRSIVPEELQDLPTNGFVVTQETLDDEEGRETAIGLAGAWLRGQTYTLENPDEALEIVCERVPEECGDEAVAQAFLERKLAVIERPEGTEPGENAPFEGLETIQGALLEAGDLAGEVDLEAAFPNDYVEELNAE